MRRKRRRRQPDLAKLARLKAKRDRLKMRQIGRKLCAIREEKQLQLPPRRAPLALAAPRPELTDLEISPHDVPQVYSGLPPDAIALGYYGSLAAAQAALAREESRGGGGLAVGLAIGLGAVAILGLGVVVCYLLFRKKDEAALTSSLSAPRVLEREIIREIPTFAGEQKHQETASRSMQIGQGTTLRTFVLPSLSNPRSEAVRVATAASEPAKLWVRASTPPGSFAVLSLSPAELNIVGPSIVPTGDTLILAAGDHQEIYLSPHQALFAKGSTNGVVISVVAGELRDDTIY